MRPSTKRPADRTETQPPQGCRKSTTAEVLGNAADPPKIDPKWKWHYNILLDLHSHLRHEEEELQRDANEQNTGLQREQADVATNTFNRDWALGMLSSEQDAVYEIEDALDRIRTGRYGICEYTGRPIPQERLAAIPWTRFSVEGEREAEKRGKMERPKSKLGERQSLVREPPPESFGKEEDL